MGDYAFLGAGEESPLNLLARPFRIVAGATGLMLAGTAGWVAHSFSHDNSGVDTSSSFFQPKEGLEKILVKAGPAGPLALVPHPGFSAIFLYSSIPEHLTESSASSQEAWAYGVKLNGKFATFTGQGGDIVKGKLLSWTDITFKAHLEWTDKFYGYTGQGSSSIKRGQLSVVLKDGSSRQAYWYYESTSIESSGGPLVPLPPKLYLLEYKYVEGILERREPYRAAHLAHAKKELAHLVGAGAFPGPPLTHSALFVFRGKEYHEIEEFAKTDPFVTSGLVLEWKINQWICVLGELATPLPLIL
eukprot:gb/GEZN01013813.1/.p1 GENE.gb/GEZN01013813.1/~~gb/GEZN01013813.1/.p1  ORF type:complete len:302 (+),score=25.48 gb/GEZN01013813.1/:37-942(+)